MELKTRPMMLKEFVDSVKKLSGWEIYVFTPDGAVRFLPKGDSGPIDFTTNSAPESRGKSNGTKVNGRMVPSDNYKLKNRGSGWNCHHNQLPWTSRDCPTWSKTKRVVKDSSVFKNQDKEIVVSQ